MEFEAENLTKEQLLSLVEEMAVDLEDLLNVSANLLNHLEVEDAYARNCAIDQWKNEALDAGLSGSKEVFNALTMLDDSIAEFSQEYGSEEGFCTCLDCTD